MGSIAFTAPHSQAADIGFALLKQGASAIDAMVAAAAAITVVYPHMNSLGGDGFWLIHYPGQAPVAIDACGTAAALAEVGFYQGMSSIPTRGGAAALTMAGTLEGWHQARLWHTAQGGTVRPLGELVAPATGAMAGCATGQQVNGKIGVRVEWHWLNPPGRWRFLRLSRAVEFGSAAHFVSL